MKSQINQGAVSLVVMTALTVVFYSNLIAQMNIGFTASPTSGCAPLQVAFTNESNAGSNYVWDFGDGTPADTIFSPNHTYYSAGTFTVTLTAYNNQWNFLGNSTGTIQITNESVPDSFNMSSDELCPGEYIEVSYGAAAAAYQWDFGDGTPPSFDQWAFHSYSDSGTFDITLVVETFCGINTLSQQVTVSSNALPNSGFTLSSNPACTGDEVIFETVNYMGTTYLWNFGDGFTSNFYYEYHTYNTDSAYIVSLTVTNICGNSSTTYDTLVVSSSSVPPVPAFYASAHSACPNVPIDFYYWNPAASYFWNFGDGATDSFPYTNHSFANPGNYPVTLTVSNGCGNSNSYTDTIRISNNATPPIPYFTPSLLSACPGQDIYFNTSVYADSYLWDFGDGNTDNQPYTSHAYTASGTYTVTLTVSNACGNSNTFSRTITVNSAVTPPVPYFSFSPLQPCPGDEVQFYSWTDADSYLWDFGDGNTSPDFYYTAHSYADTGIYTVTLTVTNVCGNNSSYSHTVTVSSATAPPVPYFSSSLQEACPGENIEFYSYVSASSYLWNFGDGATDSLYGWVSHSYDTTGNFTVTLTITNSCGNFNSWSQNIQISDSIIPPVPYFSFYPDSVCPGDSIQFYAWGVTGNILWDFGDGITDSAAYLYHRYDTAGNYTVTLTVTNQCGNSNSFSQTVTVSDNVTPPIPWFSVSSNNGCPGEEFQFYYWGTAESYNWDFGDGNSDTLPYTTHTFSDTGNFTVTLTITNSCGNSSSWSELINISDTLSPAVPFFSFYPDSACPGELIEFYSYDYSNQLLWDFGDGTYDTLSYLYHAFDSTGTYLVTLTATNICGNSSSYSQTVNVSGGITPPVPYFSYSANVACPGETIDFYNWDNAASWLWDFGDVATDTVQYTSHAYSDTGSYSVTLTITNVCGNTNSWTEAIQVTDTTTPPVPWFWASPNPACPGEAIQFNCWDNAVSYDWDFGDGNTGSGQTIFHTYSTAGNFSVMLTVTNACGNSNSYTDAVYTDTTITPSFYIYSDYYTLCPADTFIFYTDFNGASYQWDFGDGNSSNSVFPWYGYYAVKHAYDSAGSFTVSLTATNTCGNSAIEFAYVDVVDSGLPVDGGFYWMPPDSMTYHPCDTIQFYAWGGPNYSWDFGDGNTATSSSPLHIYDNNGWFTVSVTIFNGCGNSKTYIDSIEITGTCLVKANSISIHSSGKILIFPNPTAGNAVVRSDDGKLRRLEIYNIMGEVIYSAGNETESSSLAVDMSHLPGGIYYLKTVVNSSVFHSRISIVR